MVRMRKACGGIAKKFLLLVILCAVLCLVADIASAAPRKNKRKRDKKRKKSRPLLINATRTSSTRRRIANLWSPSSATLSGKRKTIPNKQVQPTKPHIVFIIADDLGYNDVGYTAKGTGCLVDTPVIDGLAYSGVRLRNYYVQPSCTPTRASLLTGRYPIRLGLQQGNIDPKDPTCLPLDETTLPEKLRELGYATHAVGKWHLGFSRRECLPTHRGFDSYFGSVLGCTSHYSYTHRYAKALYNNERVEWGYDGVHSSELYTHRAVDIIRNHNVNVPLFLYISHQAVHNPLEVPETVLIFTSDNGGKRACSGINWPFRGEKNTLWEGGIKGVAFINSPLLPLNVTGKVKNGLMHVSDWFPTLIEGVAGGSAEGKLPLDGVNMWPAIAQGRRSPRFEILHNIRAPSVKGANVSGSFPATPKEHDTWGRLEELPFDPSITAALRHGRWKLLTGYSKSWFGSWVPPPEAEKEIIPMEDFDHEGVYIRLYSVVNDPLEKVNLATTRRIVVDKLLRKLKVYYENSAKPIRGNDQRALPVKRKKNKGLAWKPWLP